MPERIVDKNDRESRQAKSCFRRASAASSDRHQAIGIGGRGKDRHDQVCIADLYDRDFPGDGGITDGID